MVLVEIINWIVNFISTTGYPGIFFLMTLESLNIPIPSEAIMPFAGYLIFLKRFDFIFVILIGSLGNLFGSLVSYYIGLKDGKKFIDKYGKYLLLNERDTALAEKWFRRHGDVTIFFSRLLPIVRTFVSLPAGIGRMNIKKFTFYTFAGSLVWSALLTYIGFLLGSDWNTILNLIRPFEIVIIVIFVLLLILWKKHRLSK